MTIDLAQLSTRELDSLITKAKKRKVALKKRKPAATVRRKLASLARAEGYTVEELFGGAAAGTGAAPAPKPPCLSWPICSARRNASPGAWVHRMCRHYATLANCWPI